MNGWGAADIAEIVGRVVDRADCRVGSFVEEHVLVENFTTQALVRVHGELDDGAPWSVIAKVLRPASAAPMFEQIPEQFRESALEDLNWLDEPRVYRSPVAADAGGLLRFPELFRLDNDPTVADAASRLGDDDRIVLWLEDVPDTTEWDLRRYRSTAVALGELAGRWPEDRATTALCSGRRSLASLFFGKVQHNDLVNQAEDAFWQRPDVVAVVDDDHRRDLFWLATVMPQRLERLASMPHPLAHGDASPDNFREPGDGTIVGLDWSYAAPAPAGSDLGQLVAGRVESGAATDLDLDALASAVVDGYAEGLAEHGTAAPDRAAIEEAFLTYLAIRSTFSALLLDPVDVDDCAGMDRLRARAELARWTMDRVRSHEEARSHAV